MALQLNYQSAGLRVCVDSAEAGKISGRIVGRRLSTPILFSDINELIVQVDALLDTQKFPQAFQRIRSFTDKRLPTVPAVRTKEELERQQSVDGFHGHVITFVLQIRSRKNASWQGRVDWLDGHESQIFNSTLEFLKHLDARLQIE